MAEPNATTPKAATNPNGETSGYSALMSAAGYVLAISYPVLALSTGVRALYQLFFKADVANYVAPALSLVAALVYLLAAIGFAYRRTWTWWLSLGALAFETLFVLLIGTLSFTHPDLIGHTVWTHFGQDYGWFPLIQPILGLAWLLWPATMRLYGVRGQNA